MESRRILVATDLGESADEAIRQGFAWARRMGGRLDICHVVDNPMRTWTRSRRRCRAELPDATRLLRRLTELLIERVGHLNPWRDCGGDFIIERGPVDECVARLAERLEVELLVVGGSGKMPLEAPSVRGGTAERIVRRARRSVLVARPSPPSGLVLAATNLSARDEPVLAAAAGEASERLGRLGLIHCVEAGCGAREGAALTEPPVEAVRSAWRLAATMKRLGAVGGTIMSEERPSVAVGAMAAEVGAELVVVGGQRPLATGGVARALVRSAKSSVLVVVTRPSKTPQVVETRGKQNAAILPPGLAPVAFGAPLRRDAEPRRRTE